MSKMIESATTDELHMLLTGLMSAETVTDEQAALLYLIVDELRERGEYQEYFNEDSTAYAAELSRKAQHIEQYIEINDPDWVEQAINEARPTKAARLNTFRRFLAPPLAAVMLILLINTITVYASGHNFVSDFFTWTDNAFYSIFGVERDTDIPTISGEMQMLQNELDELGIQVALPKSFLEGYFCSDVAVRTIGEPYILVAWFDQAGSNKQISLKVDGSPHDGQGSYVEANDWTGLDPIIVDGVIYKVYENIERLIVNWEDGSYNLSLLGEITYNEAKAVIESIGR